MGRAKMADLMALSQESSGGFEPREPLAAHGMHIGDILDFSSTDSVQKLLGRDCLESRQSRIAWRRKGGRMPTRRCLCFRLAIGL